MKKGVLKTIAALVVLMVMGNTIAEDQSLTTFSGTLGTTQSMPIPVPGGGPIGTTNWGGGPPSGPGSGLPCSGC
ncbi:MAG: hypothetical protein U0Z75_08810 [Deinococcaceae bacterium]